MREYTVTYAAGLANGLRSNPRNPRNNQYLAMLSGAIPYDNVLSTLEELPDPLHLENDIWPFPQLFHLRRMTLVCGRDRIYELQGSSLTLLIGSIETNASANCTWSVADFGEYIVMTNGIVLIERNPQTGVFAEYADCKIPPCLCVCEVNGQLLVGGIL